MIVTHEKGFFPNEIWKEYRNEEWEPSYKFLISNYGRVKSLNAKTTNTGVMKGSLIHGYYSIRGRKTDGKTKGRYIHKLVAELFVPNPENKQYVLHIDHDKSNNKASNLKWANWAEKNAHVADIIRNREGRPYKKLTDTQVIRLKRILLNPNRKTRYKILARQFGITEMQLHRIKTGENWGHIKVD